jgi:phosphatidylglycerophosphatase A/pimeloyl-ACP methyl ester carboxylesterase
MTAPLRRAFSARDGLRLSALEWPEPPDGGERLPLLCLPGIARTALDFLEVGARYAGGRRVVALDYAGHGESGRAADPGRYRVEVALRDLLDAMAALHLHRVVVLGTSFGGILAMSLGVLRPGCLAAVAMNDVGPRLEPAGLGVVREVIGRDPAFADLDEAAAFLRRTLPPLDTDDAGWRKRGREDLSPRRGRAAAPALGHPHRRGAADRGAGHDGTVAAVRGAGAPAAAAVLGPGKRVADRVHGGADAGGAAGHGGGGLAWHRPRAAPGGAARGRGARPLPVGAAVKAARVVATLGGIGLIRPAPGTWAAAFMLPLAWAGPLACLVIAAVLVAAGFWAVRSLSREGAERDPGWVVVDEGAGQLLVLSAIPAGAPWLWVVLAFALFRFFDILKWGPVGWADRRKGTFWVMLDDLVAGAMGVAVVLALRALLPEAG